MSKASDAANAVVNSTIQVCALYGVKVFRMQSRVIMVPGTAGRMRPMFFGKWTDDFGKEHNSGMADLLARPQVPLAWFVGHDLPNDPRLITVSLWIECKAGKAKLSPEQEAFRHHVLANGEHHVTVQNDLRPLMQWFDIHGLKPR